MPQKILNFLIITLFSLVFSSNLFSQTILQHQFNYKGFAIKINDDAFDENENHLLVGEIKAIETEEEKRDSNINKIFELKGFCNDESMGILISTNKDYKILKIGKSFIGEKVVYDFNKKLFTFGANFFDYIKVGERSFSAWQPVITKINLNFKGQSYFIQKPYSCILENMVIEKEEIIIFTRSLLSQEKSFEIKGKTEVIRVSTSKFHDDEVLEPISIHETSTNIGTILISNISNIDSTFYFTTSNLNQSTLKNINHLYQLKNNKLTEISSFQNYLKWNEITKESSDWININEFTVNSSKNYIFLTHEGASKKEMKLYKTDTSFNTLLSTKITLNDYADFNKMLVLSNGNIAILMANKKDTWSYYLYDSKMEFIKEIDSKIPKEYYPNNLKEMVKGRIECFYSIDNVNKKDCMIQIIKWTQ